MHAVLVLFRPLLNVGIHNFGMWGMYNLVKAYRSIKKSIANHRVEDWQASNGHTKDTTRLFHGPWHDFVGEHICTQPCRMWNRSYFHPFLQVSQIFQRPKNDPNKQDFENKLNLTCQAQSTPKTIGILTKVFCTSGPNLVILAWTGLELSHGQASYWHTDGQTDAGNDNTRWPYWPRVKTRIYKGTPYSWKDIHYIEMSCCLLTVLGPSTLPSIRITERLEAVGIPTVLDVICGPPAGGGSVVSSERGPVGTGLVRWWPVLLRSDFLDQSFCKIKRKWISFTCWIKFNSLVPGRFEWSFR